MTKASVQQSETLCKIAQHMNDSLFGGTLTECMYVFSRNKAVVGGYFCPDKWENEDGVKIPEIALNANLMQEGDLAYSFQVILHEMVHFWQHLFGKAGRNGYHNREWADKCKELGLQPVTADGKEVGQAVGTELIAGSAAEILIADMLSVKADEFAFPWVTDPLMVDGGNGEPRAPSSDEAKKGEPEQAEQEQPAERKAGKRDKYTCSMCGAAAWGKAGMNLICGDCNRPMINGN